MSDSPSMSLNSDDYENTAVGTQVSHEEESYHTSSQSSAWIPHEAINGTSLFSGGDLISDANESEQ